PWASISSSALATGESLAAESEEVQVAVFGVALSAQVGASLAVAAAVYMHYHFKVNAARLTPFSVVKMEPYSVILERIWLCCNQTNLFFLISNFPSFITSKLAQRYWRDMKKRGSIFGATHGFEDVKRPKYLEG
ncbi:hypothetical protein ACJX0J_008907, partial [Zea mays]